MLRIPGDPTPQMPGFCSRASSCEIEEQSTVPDNPDLSLEPPKSGVSRRTVVKGVAWAAPAIITVAAIPMTSASAPCVSGINAIGGTYPVVFEFTGCTSSYDTHWDFNFNITISKNTTCTWNYVRLTLYDIPTGDTKQPSGHRSTLYIEGLTSNNTQQYQYYVQRVIQVPGTGGTTVTIPTTGDKVINSHNGSTVTTIVAPGGVDDSLHVNTCNGGLASNTPMFYYTAEYSNTSTGPWTTPTAQTGVFFNQPMISVSNTITHTGSNYYANVGVSNLGNASGASSFVITAVRNGTSQTAPPTGTNFLKGGPFTLSSLTTNQVPLTGSPGTSGYLWVSFNTGADTSQNVSQNPL
jgi:hypothetical protein